MIWLAPILLIAALLGVRLSAARASGPAGQEDPQALIGRHHLLLAFTPAMTGKKFLRQEGVILDRLAELNRHDVVPLYVPALKPEYLGQRTLGPDHAGPMRERFGISPSQFAVLLVGRDGQVKLHSDRPLDGDELVALVEAVDRSMHP